MPNMTKIAVRICKCRDV